MQECRVVPRRCSGAAIFPTCAVRFEESTILFRVKRRFQVALKCASWCCNIQMSGVMANKRREEPVIRVTVGLDQSDHDHLAQLADSAGVSLAWMMRKATQEFLKRLENKSNVVVALSPAGQSSKSKK